jgi:NAD-dependent SIR2 family protein deacetylase
MTAAKRAADSIRASTHCAAFTGAGIATSSGIGDYRGKVMIGNDNACVIMDLKTCVCIGD